LFKNTDFKTADTSSKRQIHSGKKQDDNRIWKRQLPNNIPRKTDNLLKSILKYTSNLLSYKFMGEDLWMAMMLVVSHKTMRCIYILSNSHEVTIYLKVVSTQTGCDFWCRLSVFEWIIQWLTHKSLIHQQNTNPLCCLILVSITSSWDSFRNIFCEWINQQEILCFKCTVSYCCIKEIHLQLCCCLNFSIWLWLPASLSLRPNDRFNNFCTHTHTLTLNVTYFLLGNPQLHM